MAISRGPRPALIQRRIANTHQKAVIALLFIVPIILLVGGGGILAYLAATSWAQPPKQPAHRSTVTLTPVTRSEASEIQSLGYQYMQTLVQGNYSAAWSLLSPYAQSEWSDEHVFAAYMQKRFANYKLRGFTLNTVTPRPFWVNPETLTRYSDVNLLPTSLQLESQLPPQELKKLAPQFQQPGQIFQNIPLIVQRDPADQRRWQILNAGPADVEAPIIPPISPAPKAINVPILMYHYISDVPLHDPNPTLRRSLSVSAKLFGQQLDYLKSQGYHTITFNQLMSALYYGTSLPTRPVILTFDDGYDDAYTAAYPALLSRGYSGMFYIITGKVGWKGQASWDQLREMLTNGMQIGSHTIHHVDMGATYLSSRLQAQQELQISQEDLQKNLGIVIQHFCYPNGGPFKGNNYPLQQAVVSLLASDGYIDATTDPGPTGISQDSQKPFVLLRLRVSGNSTLQYFEQMMRTAV